MSVNFQKGTVTVCVCDCLLHPAGDRRTRVRSSLAAPGAHARRITSMKTSGPSLPPVHRPLSGRNHSSVANHTILVKARMPMMWIDRSHCEQRA